MTWSPLLWNFSNERLAETKHFVAVLVPEPPRRKITSSENLIHIRVFEYFTQCDLDVCAGLRIRWSIVPKGRQHVTATRL